MRSAILAVLCLAALSLSGCTDDAAGDGTKTVEEDDKPTGPTDQLHGWVFDTALRPMEGVRVNVLETNASAMTDGDGFYAFNDLPTGDPIVLVATLPEYEPASKGVTLPEGLHVRLNFTMTPVPVKVPTMEVLPFNGFIACQSTTVAQEEAHYYDCSSGQSDNVWDFSVGPELAGAVIEVAWTPGTPAADSFRATVETLGLGDFNRVLGEAVGESVLRIPVGQALAEKYYPEGGRMRLTVNVEPNVDEEEANTGGGAAVNQDFQAFASLFYVEPPSPTYSIQNDS